MKGPAVAALRGVLAELDRAEAALTDELTRQQALPWASDATTLEQLRLQDGSWPWHQIVTARANALAALALLELL